MLMTPSLHHSSLLISTLHLLPPFLYFISICFLLRRTQMNIFRPFSDNVPISRSLNLIASVKSLLPGKVILPGSKDLNVVIFGSHYLAF